MHETIIKRPPWRVTFDGSFWHHPAGARSGQVLPLEKTFSWAGRKWYLPAAYLCGQGLVLDLCMEAEAEAVRTFLQKWESKECSTSELDMLLMDAEHPLHVNWTPQITVNRKALAYQRGHGATWFPGRERNGQEARWLLDHYGLDPEKGWSIHRYCFPWATKRRPRRLSSLSLTLEPGMTLFPGPQFTVHQAGDRVALPHPLTGVEHTLTVVEYEVQETDDNFFQDDTMEYPRHYTALTYHLDPDLPQEAITLHDCRSSDRPRLKHPDPMAPQVSPGIALFTLDKEDPALHGGLSSLTFQPREEVLWQVIFQEKRHKALTLSLL